MNVSKRNEILGLVASIALAVVVAVFGILALGSSHGAVQGAATDPLRIETQTPDQVGLSHTKKGIERFNVTDVQAMPQAAQAER